MTKKGETEVTEQQEEQETESIKGPDPDATIVERLLWVQANVGKVGKSGRHQQGWSYRKYDDVINTLHEAYAIAGVLMIPTIKSWEATHLPNYGSGNHYRYDGVIVVRFVDAHGNDMVIEQHCQGMDDGDKGLGKMMSYGLKDVLARLFTLPFEDSSLTDNESAPIPPSRPWWQIAGWESEDDHDECRETLMTRTQSVRNTAGFEEFKKHAQNYEINERGQTLMSKAGKMRRQITPEIGEWWSGKLAELERSAAGEDAFLDTESAPEPPKSEDDTNPANEAGDAAEEQTEDSAKKSEPPKDPAADITALLAETKKSFTIADIAEKTGISIKVTESTLKSLAKTDLVEQMKVPGGSPLWGLK